MLVFWVFFFGPQAMLDLKLLPGVEPVSPALTVRQIVNHWTTREESEHLFLLISPSGAPSSWTTEYLSANTHVDDNIPTCNFTFISKQCIKTSFLDQNFTLRNHFIFVIKN